MPKKSDKKVFMLVDGHALMHKGYHAIPYLSTSGGEPTNAIFGFTSILLNAIKQIDPDCIAVTFDLPKPTFRHQEYVEYKSHRKPSPDDLTMQIPRVKEVVRALNIPVYEQAGYEADDLIGTLAKKIEKDHPEMDVIITTGDLDTLQLVTDRVKVYTMKKGLTDAFVYGPEEVRERYGLDPEQMVDYRALKGDPSDNIPGVTGIGEKTAADLINRFESLDKLYQAVEQEQAEGVRPKVLELLRDQKDQAYMSQKLSRIITDVDLEVSITDCRLKNYDTGRVIELFQEFEFKSLIPKLPKADVSQTLPIPVNDQTKEKIQCSYNLIADVAELEKLIAELEKQQSVVIDTETTSISALEARLVGISLSWKPGVAYYVHVYDNPQLLEILKPALEDNRILKYGHNLKYDYQVLQNSGISLSPLAFDSMIASYLANPGSRQHDLDSLAFNELGHQMIPIESLIGKGKNQISMADVPLDKLSEYACEDADITWRLIEKLMPKLIDDKTDELLTKIEMPLITVLARMERWGIGLDTQFLEELEHSLKKDLIKLEGEIREMAGEVFNINSPSQLAVILFEKLGLSSREIKKTKTGYSTAASELMKLQGQHLIIEKISHYRELAKLLSTYIEALPNLLSPADKRVHTNYNQTIAATGRLSSTDPNLQNIPIRTELGQQIRKAFVAEDGYNLIALDYSQFELRIVASLAKDEAMLEIFKKGEDIHVATASRMFNVAIEDVTQNMRRDAKTINFGVLYGLSAFGLSERTDMARHEAKEFIEKYFEAFPQISRYIDETIEETRTRGYVVNALGRRRYLPEIRSSNYMVRSGAERAAINMPIQSLNADIIKLAMIEINKTFRDESDLRMLLQVHDELVFEVRKGREKELAEAVRQIMQNVYPLEAGVVVDAKVGKNWGEMESL